MYKIGRSTAVMQDKLNFGGYEEDECHHMLRVSLLSFFKNGY